MPVWWLIILIFTTQFGEDDDKMEQGIINMDTMERSWISQWYLDEDLNSFYPFHGERLNSR